MPIHLVSCIDVKDFGAETLRIGDLNGDGAPDLLFVQSVYGTRQITCLTATTIFGALLWQTGTPSRENGRVYSDLPVQVYDWDADGCNEVLFVKQAHYAEVPQPPAWYVERALRYEGQASLSVLDALTGREKATLPLPAPADDCFLFADLTGRGRREDLVVKDRYWNMWGVAHNGTVLWHWKGATGHFPALADVDADGKDEVFVGFALLDHDGRPLFEREAGGQHQDAACIVRLPDGTWRLLFGNGGIHCLGVDGAEIWHHPLREAQHVVAGQFRPGSATVQFMVLDRGYPRTDEGSPGVLYLYDLDGREIWRRAQPPGSWGAAIVEIDWSGAGAPQEVLVYGRGPDQPAAIYDGAGQIVDTLPMRFTSERTPEERKTQAYLSRADLWGDRREEVLFSGSRGACIYSSARPLAIPTLYNRTLYPGM